MSLEAEVPEGWTQRRLGECADQRTEKALPDAADTRRYVALEHLAQGRPMILGWFPAGRAVSAKTVFHKGDLLFGKLRPNLRKAASASFDGLCSTDILPIFGKGDLEMSYLLQLAQSDDFGQYAIATASGTKMPRTSWKQLAEFVVKLPPLAEQRKIAAVLSSVDGAIEKTQAVIDQVQVVKRGLMSELLTRGFPGRHTRFKPTPIGNVPNEWNVVPLVEACEVPGQYGANVPKSNFRSGGVRYIRITDINGDGTLKEEAAGIDVRESEKYLLQAGDIVFARSGATVGKSYLHDLQRVRCAFAGYLVRFRTKSGLLLPAFLKEYVSTAAYWRWVEERRRVQAQPNINAAEYGQLPVPCPPLDEQRAVVQIAEALDATVRTEKMRVTGLADLKRALMAVLLTGELRVTPDPQAA